MSEAIEEKMSAVGIILSGLDKSLMDYLTQNQGNRYLTVNNLSLALGSNDLLLKRALKTLMGYKLIVERESDAGDTTYHISEHFCVEETSQTPKVVTPEPSVTEKEMPDPVGESVLCPSCGSANCIGNGNRQTEKGPVQRYVCKACEFRFSEGRVYLNRVGRPKGQSKESVELDAKIKEQYPDKQMNEIATDLGVDYGTVRGRVTRLRQKGEISVYSHYPSKAPKVGKKPPSIVPKEIKSAPRCNSFNIGQLLKVNSENQVAVVNATLEVVDEHGSQYEVTIIRKGKGVDGRGPVGLELGVDVWKQLDDILDYHGAYLEDQVEDESIKEDDPEIHQMYVRQLEAMKVIRSKIQRDVKIPEEKVK